MVGEFWGVANGFCETGVSFDNEEHEEGIICMAVPIIMQNRNVIGGLSITVSKATSDFSELEKYKNDLQNTAHDIANDATIWMLPKMRG